MQDITSHISTGWAAHRGGQNDDAIRHFESALAADNENIDAYYGLGLAERGRGRLAEAAAAFEKALQLTSAKLEMSQPTAGVNAVEVPEIDRYMMLIRMIDQRLEEIQALTKA